MRKSKLQLKRHSRGANGPKGLKEPRGLRQIKNVESGIKLAFMHVELRGYERLN
jgi:hypothetical protein